MNVKKIIDGLHFTIGMILFNPLTGENKTPDQLNEDDRITYDACTDAIEALRVQEPRVMTLEEVLENAQKIGFPCWVEDHIEDTGSILVPAVVTSDDTYIQYTGNDYYEGAIYHWAYNKRLRCWTAKPTDEQREMIPWK